MTDIKQKIKLMADEYFEEIRNIRQHLHKHPELSFEENKTADFICQKLTEYNISYRNKIAGNGIIAEIKGEQKSDSKTKVIALRADMDALPIVEENNVEYKSQNHGKMHACGHDVHTSSLLGTAKILQELRADFSGIVLLIFQHAEERIPGGAKLILESGALENPKPDIIIAQHVMPSMEVGTVGFKGGMYMASSDEIFLTVKGKGGHAAMPHQINDTVLIASQIIVSLQQIVSRFADASIPTVLSFGKIVADGAVNVIPSEVRIEGTFRTMNEIWREEAKKRITEISKSIAKSMGADCDVEIKKGYPFLVNDEKITKNAKSFSESFLSNEMVEDMDIRMTAEDFSYYSQKIPSCFYRLGTRNKQKGINSPLHSSTFDIDENALKVGAGLMAWLAFSFLK